MTTPPRQPQGQQPIPTDQQLALAAAGVLATAVTVTGALAVLAPLFAKRKVSHYALQAALEVVMHYPPDAAGFYGPAGAQTARLNLIRRAQFLVNSAHRLTGEYARLRAGEITKEDMAAALVREARYYGQHQEAIWARQRAAAQADSASQDYGALLGWYAEHDRRTSPECRAADRHNFRVDRMPSIGFPGGVHIHCRCFPGPPFPGAPLVGSNVPQRSRAKAGV